MIDLNCDYFFKSIPHVFGSVLTIFINCCFHFRYDARGTLYDLKLFEAPSTSYDRFHGLSAEERQLERRCDEERYFALYKDEAEEAVIREEELKRLSQDLCDATSGEVSYRQVPFSYDNSDKVKNSINIVLF